MQIGHRLRQIREQRALSQGRLARLIGVSTGSIQNYEHGRVHIPDERIFQLALALHCRPEELLMPPGAPIPGDISRRRRSRG